MNPYMPVLEQVDKPVCRSVYWPIYKHIGHRSYWHISDCVSERLAHIGEQVYTPIWETARRGLQ